MFKCWRLTQRENTSNTAELVINVHNATSRRRRSMQRLATVRRPSSVSRWQLRSTTASTPRHRRGVVRLRVRVTVRKALSTSSASRQPKSIVAHSSLSFHTSAFHRRHTRLQRHNSQLSRPDANTRLTTLSGRTSNDATWSPLFGDEWHGVRLIALVVAIRRLFLCAARSLLASSAVAGEQGKCTETLATLSVWFWRPTGV